LFMSTALFQMALLAMVMHMAAVVESRRRAPCSLRSAPTCSGAMSVLRSSSRSVASSSPRTLRAAASSCRRLRLSQPPSRPAAQTSTTRPCDAAAASTAAAAHPSHCRCWFLKIPLRLRPPPPSSPPAHAPLQWAPIARSFQNAMWMRITRKPKCCSVRCRLQLAARVAWRGVFLITPF
jgi:hypothetical protein